MGEDTDDDPKREREKQVVFQRKEEMPSAKSIIYRFSRELGD